MSDLFNSLGSNQKPRPQQTNPMQMVQDLKSDPRGFLKNRGFDVPDGVDTSNPQSIINGLMQSGQVGNSRFQRAIQTARKMFGR